MNTIGFQARTGPSSRICSTRRSRRPGPSPSDQGTIVSHRRPRSARGVKASAVLPHRDPGLADPHRQPSTTSPSTAAAICRCCCPSGENGYTRAGKPVGQRPGPAGHPGRLPGPSRRSRSRRTPSRCRSPSRARVEVDTGRPDHPQRGSASWNWPPSSTTAAWKPSATNLLKETAASGAPHHRHARLGRHRHPASRATPKPRTSMRSPKITALIVAPARLRDELQGHLHRRQHAGPPPTR